MNYAIALCCSRFQCLTYLQNAYAATALAGANPPLWLCLLADLSVAADILLGRVGRVRPGSPIT